MMRRSNLELRKITKLAMKALILVSVFWTELVRAIPVDSKNMYETFLSVNSNLKSCSNYNVKHLETDRFKDLCSLPSPNLKDYAQDKAKIKEGLKFNLTPLLCYTIFHNVYAVCHPDTNISVNKEEKSTSSGEQFCEVIPKISLPETCTHWLDDPEGTSKDDCFLVNEVVAAVLNNKEFCQNKCLVPDPDKTIPSSVNPLCIELLDTSKVLAQMAPKGQPSEEIKGKDPGTNLPVPPGLAKPENKTNAEEKEAVKDVADGSSAIAGENMFDKNMDGLEGNGTIKALDDVAKDKANGTANDNVYKKALKDHLIVNTKPLKESKVKHDQVTDAPKVNIEASEKKSKVEESQKSKSKVNTEASKSKHNLINTTEAPKFKSKSKVSYPVENDALLDKSNINDESKSDSPKDKFKEKDDKVDDEGFKAKVEQPITGIKKQLKDDDTNNADNADKLNDNSSQTKDIELKDKASKNKTIAKYNKTNSKSKTAGEENDSGSKKINMASSDVDIESSSSFASGFGFDYDSSTLLTPESDKDIIMEPVQSEKSNTEEDHPPPKKIEDKKKSDESVDAEALVAEKEKDKAVDIGDVKQEENTIVTDKTKDEDNVDEEVPKAEKELIETKYENNMKTGPEVDERSSFFGYFILLSIVAIIAYLVFHNKQKILALVLEGRRRQGNRRRSGGREYRKLDSNLEVL